MKGFVANLRDLSTPITYRKRDRDVTNIIKMLACDKRVHTLNAMHHATI